MARAVRLLRAIAISATSALTRTTSCRLRVPRLSVRSPCGADAPSAGSPGAGGGVTSGPAKGTRYRSFGTLLRTGDRFAVRYKGPDRKYHTDA